MSAVQGEGGVETDVPGEGAVGEDDAGDTGDTGPSRDDVYGVLSNHRRRYAIHYLQQTDGTVELGPLAETVAAWENGTTVDSITSQQRKRVYTSLQQFHLPKMAEKNVVDFDSRAGTVELTGPAANLQIYFEVVDEYDLPWSLYYVGLSAAGAALLGLSWLGVGPFGPIPLAAWAVFVVVALGVSALTHTYVTHRNQLGKDGAPPEVDVGGGEHR